MRIKFSFILILFAIFLSDICFAFSYIFDSDTVLFISHPYGYHEENLKKKALEIIQNVLQQNGKVVMAYNTKEAGDLSFKEELDNYHNLNQNILYVPSTVGELVNDSNSIGNSALPLNSITAFTNLTERSNIYVIGIYLGAGLSNTIYNVSYIISQSTNVAIKKIPIIHLDFNLIVNHSQMYQAIANIKKFNFFDILQKYNFHFHWVDQYNETQVSYIKNSDNFPTQIISGSF